MNKPDKVILDKVVGFKIPTQTYYLDSKKALLYNVSLGYSKDPLNMDDLNYTYELAEDFKICPTLQTTMFDFTLLFNALVECPGIPEFNPMMLLHGE